MNKTWTLMKSYYVRYFKVPVCLLSLFNFEQLFTNQLHFTFLDNSFMEWGGGGGECGGSVIFPVSLAWVLAWISWDFAWGLEHICEDYNFLSMSYLWVISFSILGKGLLSSIVYVPKVFTWIHGSSKKVFLKIFVWPKNFYVAQTFLWRRKTFCGQI